MIQKNTGISERNKTEIKQRRRRKKRRRRNGKTGEIGEARLEAEGISQLRVQSVLGRAKRSKSKKMENHKNTRGVALE